MTGVASFVSPLGTASLASWLLDVIVSIMVVAASVGLAEEIGWRGYMLPRLMGLGAGRAVLSSGFLHGVWHLPVLLGTPFYHPEGSRLFVVPSFLLTITLAGICYGYLRLTSGSVWPAAIAHASFNVCWERFHQATVARSPETLEYLSGESGLLTIGALAVAAAWFHSRSLRRI